MADTPRRGPLLLVYREFGRATASNCLRRVEWRVELFAAKRPRRAFEPCGQLSLPGRYTKNKKDAAQPLPPAVVARLHLLLAAVPPGEKVWAGSWRERSAEMFRADLAKAKIPAEVNGEHAVFHSLRQSYATMLGRSAPIKVVQELARHSTPVLTIGKYSHTDMGEKAEAVARLPLPGSAHHSPLSSLYRPELEAVAEGLAALFGSVLFTPRFTPEPQPGTDSDGRIRNRDETGPILPFRRIA